MSTVRARDSVPLSGIWAQAALAAGALFVVLFIAGYSVAGDAVVLLGRPAELSRAEQRLLEGA